MVKTIKNNGHRVLSLVLVAFLVLGMISFTSVTAHAVNTSNQTGGTSGWWTYTLVNGQATNVHGNNYSWSGSVTIPTTLDGYPVTSLGDGAGAIIPNNGSRMYVTSVSIPESVTLINDYAFYGCLGLRWVNIPSLVTSIGDGVFGSTALTSIYIPSSVTSIGEYAFSCDNFLTSFNIPSSVTSIGKYAFYNCPGSTSNKVVIPKNVTFIGSNAFDNTLGVHYYASNPVANAAKSAYTGTYTWTPIDEVVPTVSVSVPSTPSTSALITLNLSDNSGISHWAVTNNTTIPVSWTSVTKSVSTTASWTATTNGTYYAWAKDDCGNISLPVVFTVSNIDTTAPICVLAANPISATSGDITIIATVVDANIVATKWATTSVGASSGNAFNGSFTVSENDTYYVYALDAVGNAVTTSITVNNIDKSAPVVTLTPSTTDATTSVEVAVSVSDVNTVTTKWSTTSEGASSGTAFSGSFTVSENNIYYVYAVDSIGNGSTFSIVIKNIDTVVPSIPNVTCSENENTFSVTGGTDTGSGVAGTYYRLNGGEWTSYTAPVSVEDGTYVIDAKVVDFANNESSLISTSMTAYKNGLASATSAVEIAESAKTQSSVDSATSIIETLPNISEKTVLQARITSLQSYIDTENAYAAQLATATSAVVTAESNKTQSAVDAATALVSTLRDTDKSALSARLAVVQEQINYNNLVASATLAVVTAETSKTQADVDNATTLVNQLNTTDAMPLNSRLQTVQIYINNKAQFDAAEASVVTAEKYKQTYYTNKALTLVNTLPESDGKDYLLLRLEAVACGCDVSHFTAAIAAVEKAESTEAKEDITSAQVLVNALPDTSATKADLLARLNVLILSSSSLSMGDTEAMMAVTNAEGSCTQDDYDYAYGLVSALEESSVKILLISRLAAIVPYVNATTAVESAEAELSMESYFSANTTVTALTDGTIKAELQIRLSTLLTALYGGNEGTSVTTATTAVEKAEKYRTTYYYNKALSLVNALGDSVIKTNLQDRLAALLNSSSASSAVAKATTAVINAEKYRTAYYVDKALALVKALPDGATKTSLMARLQVVINELEAKKLTVATAYVATAEVSQKQAEVTTAYKYVNALKACAEKTALLVRLDTVQAAIDILTFDADLKEATTYVAKAESSLTEYYYNKAFGLVNDFMDGAEKTALLERLVTVRAQLNVIAVANATTAVERAEKYKTQYYYDTAITLVSALPDGDAKPALLDRLAAITLVG